MPNLLSSGERLRFVICALANDADFVKTSQGPRLGFESWFSWPKLIAHLHEPTQRTPSRVPCLTACVDRLRTPTRCDASWWFGLVLILATLGWASLGVAPNLAVYALSFWHYYLYWLAYYFGAVSLSVFKRDAILMKTASLAALGYVYLSVPWNVASMAVVAAGFLLNTIAARALGSDRTYYGYEVADLPPLRITSFPYSWISHPMLVGNIAAFSGTMINPAFRQAWWPLACLHVVMNLGLLFMELVVTPERRQAHGGASDASDVKDRRHALQISGCLVVAGAMLAIGAREAVNSQAMFLVGAGACALAYAYAVYGYYSVPTSRDT